MKERNYISWCNCSLIINMMKGSQKIARRVPRKTVKTTTRWEDAVLLLFWLFLSFELMKLMSFVIFEKFLRIPDEKMSPLSGKYILRKKVLKSFICSGKNLDWFFIPVKKNWKSWRLKSSSQMESGLQWRRRKVMPGLSLCKARQTVVAPLLNNTWQADETGTKERCRSPPSCLGPNCQGSAPP